MNINWNVRWKNEAFWMAIVPAALLLVQVVAAVFGFTLDFGELGNKLLAVINAVFALLTILGVVTDPTTAGLKDSKQALTYVKPKKDLPMNEERKAQIIKSLVCGVPLSEIADMHEDVTIEEVEEIQQTCAQEIKDEIAYRKRMEV